MSDVAASPEQAPESGSSRGRALRLLLVVVVAIAIVVLAAWLVGPTPRPADAGFPEAPPPLALPSDTPEGSPLARAAALLAAGQLDGARAGFVDVVADDQDGVAGQVGLVLSRWRSTGPESVERDLNQLTLEYPESALAALHLGLVQALLGDDRQARASLRSALELGREAADPTSLRMARLADDLLHPDAFRGTLPVLVQAVEVREPDRAAMRRLLAAVTVEDRTAATKVAAELVRSPDALARAAAISATFDKDQPDAATQRLDRLALDPAAPAAARDRARFLASLAALWGGLDRAEGCTRLGVSTAATVDAATRRLAVPIHAEICTDKPHGA